jgi:hypothetical protein
MGATSNPSPAGPFPARDHPSSSDGRNTSIRSGERNTGSHPSATSAASATFLGPIAAR